jgi:CRISPR-associated protein Csm2
MEVKFWKDKSKKHIEPELFSSKAEELAKKIFDEGGGRLNNPTQIRKFYDEVVRFDSMVKSNPAEFDSMIPYLKMLNAKAAYAMGRDLVSKSFKDFINSSLKQIHDRDDFTAFAGLFEAFMGYYKFYDKKGERPRGGAR